jgi:hypothetical protein
VIRHVPHALALSLSRHDISIGLNANAVRAICRQHCAQRGRTARLRVQHGSYDEAVLDRP